MGQEVPPTSDVLTPETPEVPELPPEDSQQAFVRRTASMSLGTALSRITGFLRVSATAIALGVATRIANAYTAANNTPNIVYELVLGGVLTSVFVPVFVQWLQERDREDAWDVARSVLTITFVVLSAITAITIVAAPWIVRLYMVGVKGPGAADDRAFATFCLRLFMPQIVFYGVGAVATGLLNARRRFAVPMFAPILNNVIVIATMIAFVALPSAPNTPTPSNITTAQRWLLACGTTLGVVGMTLVLLPSLRRLGFRFRWRLDWRHEAVRRVARLALWTLVYVAANQIGLLVVIVMATGKTAYFAYAAALILFQLPHAIFAVSIFTALLPAMSTRWTLGDKAGFRAQLSQGIRATSVIIIPAAAGYLVLATPVVRLLLQHGVATARGTELVASILRYFALGLFFFSLFQLLLRAYYAMQDTRTPALVNIVATGVNIGANFLFFFAFRMKVPGLALGYSVSYAFGSAALLVLIRRRLNGLDGRRIVPTLARTTVASGVTAAVAWVVARQIGDALGTHTFWAQLAQVAGPVLAGLLAFVAMALILRIDEVKLIRRQLTARWRG